MIRRPARGAGAHDGGGRARPRTGAVRDTSETLPSFYAHYLSSLANDLRVPLLPSRRSRGSPRSTAAASFSRAAQSPRAVTSGRRDRLLTFLAVNRRSCLQRRFSAAAAAAPRATEPPPLHLPCSRQAAAVKGPSAVAALFIPSRVDRQAARDVEPRGAPEVCAARQPRCDSLGP